MFRRQFLSPEPANPPHSTICVSVNDYSSTKPWSSSRAMGRNQADRCQHRCVGTRSDAVRHKDKYHKYKDSRPEWHLLKLCGMAIFADILPGERAWFGEQGVGFGASLDGPGFDTIGAVTDPLLCNEGQQAILRRVTVDTMAMLLPGDPELKGVFETQLARSRVSVERRLEFLDFMDHLMAEMPGGKDIHVILDNYCIHKRNDPWLAAHPHVVFHFTPTSASWLNQVEIWFGIFARKALKGATFRNIEELRQAIEAFVAAYGPTAKPFVWRKREVKGSQLRNTIVNLRN